MRFACAVSRAVDADTAIAEVASLLARDLAGARADLVCAFASPHHEGAWLAMAERLRREQPDALLLGCTARGVLGAGRELEDEPGIAALAAALPGVRVQPFHVADRLPELPGPDDAHVLLLADAFGNDVEDWTEELDERFPKGTKLGGIASGATRPGGNVLFLGDAVFRSGAVGVVLSGDVALDAIVAHGCRPIGPPLFVTGARENVLFELDGKPPLEVITRLFAAASPAERRLLRSALFLGVEMEAEQSRFEPGDFLIRSLLGVDPDTGALHVAASLEERRVVQLHVRDAAAAASDLERRLARYAERHPGAAAGALLFACLGRGRGLYGVPDRDSQAFARALGPAPLAGFFGNGEIGPVEGRTFLHAYTSAFAIFRPREPGPGGGA